MNARTKLIGTVALGAALLVPVAQAQSPDDRAGLRGPGGIAAQQAGGAANHPDNRAERGTGAFTAAITSNAVRPDDRAGTRGPGAYSPAVQTTGAGSHSGMAKTMAAESSAGAVWMTASGAGFRHGRGLAAGQSWW